MLQIDPNTPVDIPLSKIPDFDPRDIPVSGRDPDLPAVPGPVLAPQALRQRFAAPPTWKPELWKERRFMQRPTAHAAVLVPIVQRERPTVLLTQRTPHLSTHSGQIAFPGGKRDETDLDAADTALREAEEEIGLPRDLCEVIGLLPRYVTGTRFIITPVVALVQPRYTLELNDHEVADAFEVPLDFLMDPSHHRRHRLTWADVVREWYSMPYVEAGGQERFIWGATAAMLRNFYRFLSA